VIVDPAALAVDVKATAALRAAMRGKRDGHAAKAE
jgi:hypothetical protein